MALSSAQAAIIAKTAAISDVEFKASQITTQRLEYSRTTADIYQQLSNMDVPTPPQQADFNRIEYTFRQGTTPTTMGVVRPEGNGRYTIEFKQQMVGNLMQGDGTVPVHAVSVPSTIPGDDPTTVYYASRSGGDRQIFSLLYAAGYDSEAHYANAHLPETDPNYQAPNTSHRYFSQDQINEYVEAYKNAHPDSANASELEILGALCVYFDEDPGTSNTNANTPHFLDSRDVILVIPTENDGIQNYLDQYECIANGTYTETTNWSGCRLTFDGSDGRILTIQYPENSNGSGSMSRPVNLEANETTDTAAYNDAFNQYEYKQHLYEQEQAKLNAQLEDIQYEDKKLEVELQGLQTQRSAMQKELESLQKVRDDGVESGFKGFA